MKLNPPQAPSRARSARADLQSPSGPVRAGASGRDRLHITLRDVSLRRGSTWVLKEISLDLEPGERWALIGANGAGKTQLLKLLAADLWPTPTGHEHRLYHTGSERLAAVDAKQRIAYLGAELQDKYVRYAWNLTVEDLIVTGLHRSDLLLRPASAGERRQAAAILTRCGLARCRQRKFLSLSYGQKRLVLLARALVQKPDWLLLDELYNGLDRKFRQRIDALLTDARRRAQSWIVAAHRTADVPSGTSGLIELRDGRLAAVRRLRRGDLMQLDAGAAAATGTAPAAVSRIGVRRLRGGATLVRLVRADVFVEYRPVLRQVDWELRRGHHWAVTGANGAGKSTFLKLLYGDLSPAVGGTIERTGVPRGTPIDAWKRRVGFVSPELQSDHGIHVKLLELVASGRYASVGLNNAPTAADLRAAQRWLRFFSLASFARRQPRELSYGQLRRALFARALCGAKRILLLDEPLTGLDPRQRAAMKRMLERLMRRGITLVIAVHHLEDLPRGITHVLHLAGQRARVLGHSAT